MEKSAKKDRSNWTLETLSFEEAEEQTRAYWHAATSEERFAAAAKIKETVHGKSASIARLQRVLTIVPGP